MDTTIEQKVAMDEAIVPHAQRVHGQTFDEPPFKEEILAFICFLGHSATIRTLTNVNINKLYQPCRSFDPSISRRNKVNWHFVRDDFMFSIIKLVFKHQKTQHFGTLLPIELTNTEIRNSKAYKEYYAVATGEAAPKPKANVRRTRSSSDTSITPPTAIAGPRMTTTQKDEETGFIPGVPDVPTDESEEELSWNSTDDEDADDEGKDGDDDEEDEGDDGEEEMESRDDKEEGGGDEQESDEETREEESFDPIPQTPKCSEDEGNGTEDIGLIVEREERLNEEEKEDELYRDQESSAVSSQFVTSMLNPTLDVGMESIFETTSRMDTNQFAGAVSAIPIIIQKYMDQRMNEAVKVAVQIQLDRLCNEAQRENDEFLRIVDENIKKIIKEQVKEQVKVQVSKILPRIEQAINEQLEADVLTRSSHSSRTSYVVFVDLSEMELNKILIEKMEGNKSIQRSDEQRNPYKALVEAYESDKIILDTYEETVTLKRRRDDDEDNKEPFDGPDRGSKRCREGKEPESASAPSETATKSAGRSTKGSKSRRVLASESALTEEPVQTTSQMEEPSHLEFDTGVEDQLIMQSSQHPEWFSQQQKPPTPDRD
nr:hypothetical protein [Tanacetum cinerariifolium]